MYQWYFVWMHIANSHIESNRTARTYTHRHIHFNEEMQKPRWIRFRNIFNLIEIMSECMNMHRIINNTCNFRYRGCDEPKSSQLRKVFHECTNTNMHACASAWIHRAEGNKIRQISFAANHCVLHFWVHF